MNYEDLIARLEKARGQDRDLDARICYAVKPALHRMGTIDDWLATDAAKAVRTYTFSIDDALTLVPEHCYVIELRELGPTRWFARIGDKADDAKSWESEGRYGNLALAAAALQARAV